MGCGTWDLHVQQGAVRRESHPPSHGSTMQSTCAIRCRAPPAHCSGCASDSCTLAHIATTTLSAHLPQRNHHRHRPSPSHNPRAQIHPAPPPAPALGQHCLPARRHLRLGLKLFHACSFGAMDVQVETQKSLGSGSVWVGECGVEFIGSCVKLYVV